MNIGAAAGVLFNITSWYKGKVPDGDYKQTLDAKNVFKSNIGTSLYAGLQGNKKFRQMAAICRTESAIQPIFSYKKNDVF